MSKLKITYRITDDEKNYFKEETYAMISFKNGNIEISISPKETRKLSDIIHWVEKDFKITILGENTKYKIDDFDKSIMDVEDKENKRISNKVYNFCKVGYQKVLDKKLTIDDLIEPLEKRFQLFNT